MKRATLGFAVLTALVLALAGCSKQGEAPPPANTPANTTGATATKAAGKKFKVVFSQCNNAEPYRAAQNALLTELMAKEPDVELSILDGQQDNLKQIEQIRTAIRSKPDLLIVAPNERGPLTAPMKEAMDAKIPTICLERDIEQPYYTTWIRCDNKEIGRMAGQFIVDELKKKNGAPKGTVVEICGLKGVEGEINRYAGAHEVFKKYPDIKVVDDSVANWLQDKAHDRMVEKLTTLPKIDCVYGHNDPMAIGAYLAAKEKGREKEMFFVGVDGLGGDAGGIKKVMDGVLAATFVYPLCVDKAAEIGLKILRDPTFKPEKSYKMDSTAVTMANAKKLYKP